MEKDYIIEVNNLNLTIKKDRILKKKQKKRKN